MKLKKFVSLALAGVLAVSMLAGCKSNGSSSTTDEPTGVNAAAVIAAMDKAVTEKVTFSASSTLQATVDKAANYAKEGVVKFDVSLLKKIDSKLSNDKLPKIAASSGDSGAVATDKVAQSYTFIVDSSDLMGASTEATVKKLADKIATEGVTKDSASKKMNELPLEGTQLEDNGDHYKYHFKYTADVAVTSGTNPDGQVTYYAVVTVTRTPSRVAE